MVGPKFCLFCKRGNLKTWESACHYCWNQLKEHDVCWLCKGTGTTIDRRINGHVTEIIKCQKCNGTGYVGKWREQAMTVNTFREILRSCGIDLFDAPW